MQVDAFKGLIADLARPAAIWSLAGGCTIGLLTTSVTAEKLTIACAALGAMYGAKAYENASAARQSATVQVAQAQASAPAPNAPAVNVENATVRA